MIGGFHSRATHKWMVYRGNIPSFEMDDDWRYPHWNLHFWFAINPIKTGRLSEGWSRFWWNRGMAMGLSECWPHKYDHGYVISNHWIDGIGVDPFVLGSQHCCFCAKHPINIFVGVFVHIDMFVWICKYCTPEMFHRLITLPRSLSLCGDIPCGGFQLVMGVAENGWFIMEKNH